MTIARIIIILFLIGVGLLLLIRKKVYENAFLSPRKTEEEALDVLEQRGTYTREAYKNLDLEECEVLSYEGHLLKGYLLRHNPESFKYVILIHGYTGNHLIGLQFIELYKELDYNVLLIDTRSHGKSGGKYPTYGIEECKDVRVWINYLKKEVKVPYMIGLHGQSMGAATALMYGEKYKDVDFIVADCGYSSAKEVLHYQIKTFAKLPPKPIFKMLNRYTENKHQLNLELASPIDQIAELKIPTLFIHGKEDKKVPYRMSEELYKAKSGETDELWLVEKADHVESYKIDTVGYRMKVQNFIHKVEEYRRRENHGM